MRGDVPRGGTCTRFGAARDVGVSVRSGCSVAFTHQVSRSSMPRFPVIGPLTFGVVCAAASAAHAQTAETRALASAEIRDIHYDVTFDHTTAPQRILKITTTFAVTGSGPVLL